MGCVFAHGPEELRSIQRHHKYKTEQCRSYHSVGYCQYGIRCHFIHDSEESPTFKSLEKPTHQSQYDCFGSTVENLLESIGVNYKNPVDDSMRKQSISQRKNWDQSMALSTNAKLELENPSSQDIHNYIDRFLTPPPPPSSSPSHSVEAAKSTFMDKFLPSPITDQGFTTENSQQSRYYFPSSPKATEVTDIPNEKQGARRNDDVLAFLDSFYEEKLKCLDKGNEGISLIDDTLGTAINGEIILDSLYEQNLKKIEDISFMDATNGVAMKSEFSFIDFVYEQNLNSLKGNEAVTFMDKTFELAPEFKDNSKYNIWNSNLTPSNCFVQDPWSLRQEEMWRDVGLSPRLCIPTPPVAPFEHSAPTTQDIIKPHGSLSLPAPLDMPMSSSISPVLPSPLEIPSKDKPHREAITECTNVIPFSVAESVISKTSEFPWNLNLSQIKEFYPKSL